MNTIKVTMYKLLRTYTTKSGAESAGIRGKIKMVKRDQDFENNFDEYDPEDMGTYESDHLEVTDSYAKCKSMKLRAKRQLKQRIVESKVFKEVEPSFLTYVEKDQIKRLHQENPEEWTPEKLSESFPALPETIKKILKAKWTPNSVERILKYDNAVIKNWKQLQNGQLAVNPMLKEHLMKFKNRKISLIDRKILEEKFIPPKKKFSDPKSSFFSSIITDSIEEKPTIRKVICSQENINKDETNSSIMKIEDIKLVKKEVNYLTDGKTYKKAKDNTKQEKLVFEEFLKTKLNNPNETSPEEKVVLMDTYKKYVESKNLEDVSSNIFNNTTKDTAVEEKSISITRNVSNKDTLDIRKNVNEFQISTKTNINYGTLDTYIKEQNLCVNTDLSYTHRIKIPKNVHKRGMTYRIKDCYYDDDGEFLFRVPGLKN